MAIFCSLVEKVSIPAEHKTKQKEYLKNGNIPIIDQGQQFVGGYTNDASKIIKCAPPVIVFGDHSRTIKYINFPFCAGADGIKVLKPKEGILPKYLYYGMQYLVSTMPDRGYARHYQYLEKMDLFIPSYAEQERIVARIEELLSQLDSGVETLKKTKAQLAVYRQAVLSKVFENVGKYVPLDSVCQHITDGDHLPPPKAVTGIPFIMISNIENNHIFWENTAHVSKEYYQNIDLKRKPKKGDVLYTVTGTFGVPILIDYDKEFCFQRHIALLRPNEQIQQKYLFYALMSPRTYAQAKKGATGTAQKTVGLGILRKISIPYVDDLTKQDEIVRKIESQMVLSNSIDQTVDFALQQAATLRQSIFMEAFTGRI